LGIALGPMVLAPLSEVHGRQPVYTTGIFLFSILQIPAALSPSYAGVIVSRLLAGCFAGIPLSNVGASAADLFTTSKTAWPIMMFSFCSQVVGACLGPVIGSAIYVKTGSLNWLYWTSLIAGMVTFVSKSRNAVVFGCG
jgi:MFS family permease